MILLTGATGRAGSLIARRFIGTDVPLRVLVRNDHAAERLAGAANIEIVRGDMADPGTLGAALQGVERALMISSPSPDMVDTQCAFIDAARAAGARHIVKFSGLDARPDTTFPFGVMHLAIEHHLERSGLAWTHFRPTGFMQEYLREVPAIVEAGALFLPLGDTVLSPVDLEDVGEVGFRLLRDGGHEGERLAMTGPEALSMADIAERIGSAIGRSVRYVPISREQRHAAMIAHGIPVEMADALDLQAKERLKGGPESHVDVSTHRAFGIEPTSFLDFARRNAVEFSRMPPSH